MGVLVLILISALAIFTWMRARRRSTAAHPSDQKHGNNPPASSSTGTVFSIWNFDGKLAYEEIIEATGNFHEGYCIGRGSCGSVYRAELATGQVVAVKKLHQLESEAAAADGNNQECFKNEIPALLEVRHRNIVKLYGFCSSPQCMFLVCEYMERGSLASILKDVDEETSTTSPVMEFSWDRRVSAVKDVAHALSYMHHDCTAAPSNNILLDKDFKVCISDFGIARILKPDSSCWTEVAGTYGYIAPDISFIAAQHLLSCFDDKLVMEASSARGRRTYDSS